jgi:hypothetical protein
VWRRTRRKSLAPRRPAIFPEQWGIVLVTALFVGLGIAFVVVALALG